MSLGSRFMGVGMHVPHSRFTNDDLSQRMDTSDEWIRQRTGVEARHWVEPHETTSDLALHASVKAIESAGISKDQIDLIIVATLSPDHDFPGTACFLQAKLGLSGCAALDVRQQCTGFLYATSIADQFIRSGMYSHILVVGAEVHSKGLDQTPRGRDVSVLFGDGAGAVVMGRAVSTDERSSRILSTHLHADGAFAKELWLQAPGMAYPEERLNVRNIEAGEHYPKMNGKAVFVHAIRRMPEAILEALNANALTIADVDLFIFHQANLRINEAVAKQLGIPSEKVFNTIQKYANTTAATIPIGLAEAERAGVLKPGMLVASAAFGSGFTWGSALFYW